MEGQNHAIRGRPSPQLRRPALASRFTIRVILAILSSCIIYIAYMQHYLVSQSLANCAPTDNAPQFLMAHQRQALDNHAIKYTSSQMSSSASTCKNEFGRITAMQIPGLTSQDLRRSQAWIGNQYRLVETMSALSSRQRPVVAVIAGGSISLGHGVAPESLRYADRLESWMNDIYPIQNGSLDDGKNRHKVINVAAHGADMCAMAKRLNVLYSDLSTQLPPSSNGAPDIIILEFAVNDYQGQDHLITVDSKTSVFFDGFRELVLCAEVVIYSLLNKYPNTAILFLEMQTAIATRKTGALLHMGVAQAYQIPVVSYAEALFPSFWDLIHILEERDPISYSFQQKHWLPNGGIALDNTTNSNISSAVLPFPHGCSPCKEEHINKQFRNGSCKSICTFLERSQIIHDRKLKCDAKKGQLPPGGQECFVPFFAHDAIHPSAIGHAIAKDLIVHTLASAELHACEGNVVQKSTLPLTTFVADDFHQLSVRANYLVVKDVARIFSRWDKMLPVSDGTIGFELYADDQLKQRPGWIATNPLGNSSITFSVDLPPGDCYVIYLAILRSYKGMGTFRVQVRDYGDDTKKKRQPNAVTDNFVDGLWAAPISVWSDVQITEDNVPGCTGYCEITVVTNPMEKGRDGNKVKLLTLSVRRCSDSKKQK